MKKGVVILSSALVLLVVIVISGFTWYKGTVGYSLQQVKKAVEKNNYVLFEQYVDVDAFSESFADQLVETALKSDEDISGDDGWEALGMAFAAGMAEVFKPTLVSQVKRQTKQLVTEGAAIDSILDTTLTSRKFISILSKNTKIQKAKNAAALTAMVPQDSYDTTLAVELKLVRADDQWKITEWSNVGSYVESAKNLVYMANKRRNVENRKMIKEVIECKVANFKIISEGYYPKFAFGALVESKSQRPIKSFGGLYHIISEEGSDTLMSLKVTSDDFIGSGKEEYVAWEKDLNAYDDEDIQLIDTDGEGYTSDLEITEVALADGDIILLLPESSD